MKNEWRTAEQPPESTGYYLTLLRFRTSLGRIMQTHEVLLYDAQGQRWNIVTTTRVLAWMPLPELPEHLQHLYHDERASA